jgi:hypothetical protein
MNGADRPGFDHDVGRGGDDLGLEQLVKSINRQRRIIARHARLYRADIGSHIVPESTREPLGEIGAGNRRAATTSL